MTTDKNEIWANKLELMREDESYWIQNKLIEKYVYTLITGKYAYWLTWILEEFLPRKTYDSFLSICCGDGIHELQVCQSGKFKNIHAFDHSNECILNAKKRFDEIDSSECKYTFDVKDANRTDGAYQENQFDVVLSAGALHHLENLEGLIQNISKWLKPEGYLLVLEYVGPNQFQWTDKQLHVINQLLSIIPDKYLRNPNSRKLGRPTIEEMNAIDPTEAIRSEDIIDLLKIHFKGELHRPYNGTILHQLYPLLNHGLATQDPSNFEKLVEILIKFEEITIESKALEPDFTFMALRGK